MRKLLLMILFAPVAYAEPCVDIQDDGARLSCFDELKRCAVVKSGTRRLSCYDDGYIGAEEPMSGREVTVTASEPVRVAPAKSTEGRVAAEKPDDFGKRERPTDPVEYIEAEIVDVMTNKQRIDYLRLDNGQIWREAEDFRVRYKVGKRVRIEKAMLGSYNLRFDGLKKLVKVRRVN